MALSTVDNRDHTDLTASSRVGCTISSNRCHRKDTMGIREVGREQAKGAVQRYLGRWRSAAVWISFSKGE